jgi:hypothetical protein
MKRFMALGFVVLVLVTAGVVLAASDFGSERDDMLVAKSQKLFGVVQPLEASSAETITAEQAQADATRLVTLAQGLRARVVSSGVAGVQRRLGRPTMLPQQ